MPIIMSFDLFSVSVSMNLEYFLLNSFGLVFGGLYKEDCDAVFVSVYLTD